MGFWSYYKGVFLRPAATMRELVSDGRKLKFGVYAILIPAIGYTLFYFMAWKAGGSPSTFKPWLAIPIEKYFFWDLFLTIPAYFVSILLSTSVLYLLSKLMGGSGSWDDTFSVLALSAGVATWSTMLHDLTDSLLGFIGIINMKHYELLLNTPTFWRALLWTLFLIYFAWFFVLFIKGIKESQKLSWFKSVIVGILGVVVYQVMLLVFIR